MTRKMDSGTHMMEWMLRRPRQGEVSNVVTKQYCSWDWNLSWSKNGYDRGWIRSLNRALQHRLGAHCFKPLGWIKYLRLKEKVFLLWKTARPHVGTEEDIGEVAVPSPTRDVKEVSFLIHGNHHLTYPLCSLWHLRIPQRIASFVS